MEQEKIAIVVDSGCDLPKEWLTKYHIFEVPLQVMIGEVTYQDKQNITTREVYRALEAGQAVKTSLPTGAAIQTIFDQVKDAGFTHLLAFTISSQLSGTYQLMSLLAAEQQDLKIHVFDTKNMSIGAGLFALHAARLVEQGWMFTAIINEVCDTSRSHFIGEVETLEYLHRGGRISSASAKLGTVFNIKPLLEIDESGQVAVLAKVKGRKKMQRLMLETLDSDVTVPNRFVVAIEGNDELTDSIETAIQTQYPEIKEVIHSRVGAAFGVHVGPKVTVMAIYQMY